MLLDFVRESMKFRSVSKPIQSNSARSLYSAYYAWSHSGTPISLMCIVLRTYYVFDVEGDDAVAVKKPPSHKAKMDILTSLTGPMKFSLLPGVGH